MKSANRWLSGSSFSDALKPHSAVFDPTFVATVAAGEASGRMAEVLQQLAQMQKNEIRRGREIRALLTYPVLLFLVSSSVAWCPDPVRFAEVLQKFLPSTRCHYR